MSALTPRQHGLSLGLLAFSIWGMFPFAFKQFAAYSSIEVVAHRFVWSSVFALMVLLVLARLSRFQWPKGELKRPKVLIAMLFSALLMLANMVLYVYAVQTEQILAASFGYFICPVIAAGLGVVFLKERLSRVQLLALGLSVLAVAWAAAHKGGLPLISVTVAVTFALYGVVHKLTPVDPLPSLFFESLFMAPIVIVCAVTPLWLSAQPEFWTSIELPKVMLLGPLTVVPLLLYHMAAKRAEFALVSLLGFITPSLQFLVGAYFYNEPLDLDRLIAFAFAWAALFVYLAEQAWLVRSSLSKRPKA